MKKRLLIALICLLTACGTQTAETPESTEAPSESTQEVSSEGSVETQLQDEETTGSETAETIFAVPTNNEELYALFVKEWKEGDVTSLYPYASDTIQSMFGEEEFQYMFCGNFPTFGKILSMENEKTEGNKNTATYSGTLLFENAKADFQIHLDHVQIAGYYYDLRFEKPFDVTRENGVTEHYFLLQNGDYLLNAAYVKAPQDNGKVALFIPGSGPSDYNETIGILPTFQDLSGKLASQGISSLRVEKRTVRYASEWKNEDGLEEEYFQDLEAALNWLSKESPSSEVWLLGHSLGVNIAAELCNRHPVSGLILWNGSARHLAEIAADQYGAQVPTASELYHQMAENVKAVTKTSAKGTNYFSCSDYYWASYNALDTIASIKKAKLPTLIINSLLDRQIFEVDRELWQKELGKSDFVTIKVFEDQSHCGYKIDALTSSYYQLADFPDELTDEIVAFMKK